MIWPFILNAVALAPLLAMVVIVVLKRRRLTQDARRDPINDELNLLPGQSAERHVDRLTEARLDRTVFVLVASYAAAIAVAGRRVGVERPWDWFDTLICLLSLAVALFFGRRITRDMPLQRQYQQGARAELATAQLIGAALAGDNRAIHDVQAGDFNIDHVVVTPAGVFAIETKSRLKPPAGNGSPKVKYNGKTLEFPGWAESKPVEQAERQARWLANYLRKETGEVFAVTAVLALPGWWIDRTARITPDMVQVINPRNCGWLLLPERREAVLDSPAIQRAANAVGKLAQARQET